MKISEDMLKFAVINTELVTDNMFVKIDEILGEQFVTNGIKGDIIRKSDIDKFAVGDDKKLVNLSLSTINLFILG